MPAKKAETATETTTEQVGPIRRTRTTAPARKAPQDRRPRAKAAPKQPAAVAEADREQAHPDGWTPVPIGGHVVAVKPPGQWRQSAMTALREGRFNDWVLGVTDEAGEAAWRKADPTNDDVVKFMDDFGDLYGSSLGEYAPPRTSSPGTPTS